MNIYIFCQYQNYFSKDQINRLKKTANLIFVKKVQPISKNKELINDYNEKIIAIDPNSCFWKISNHEIDRISNIKAIVLNTTAYDFFDINYCRQKNIIVTNNRNFASEAVAEWLLMMSLMIARKIPVVYQGGWKIDYQRHLGMELYGKTAGIIGLGNIGKRLAAICQALGMKVIYWSPNSRDRKYRRVGLPKLIKTADFIYTCLIKNLETTKLINNSLFLSMKKNACLIGAFPQCLLLNNQTVFKQVNTGKIFGTGFEYEKDAEQFYNKVRGNILITPALAWYTRETALRNAEKWINNIINATKNLYPNRIN